MSETLKSNSDDFVALNCWATRVSGVDGGVDLNDEVGVCARVSVGTEVDARDDASSHGEAVASNGVADGANFGVELRHSSDGKVNEAF